MRPAEVQTTPSSLASDSSVRCIRLSYSTVPSSECPPISPCRLFTCVRQRIVPSALKVTSQLRPLPPRYISRPPRSNTHCFTRCYISRVQYSGCTVSISTR